MIVTEPGSEQDSSIMTDHLLLQCVTLETRQLHGVSWCDTALCRLLCILCNSVTTTIHL